MTEGRCNGGASLVAVALLALVATRLAGADDPAQLVPELPGQPAVGFKQYSGFIPAGAGKNIFYWFVTAQHGDATQQPVVFWFNGGPGCSSLGNGGLGELGPFYVKPNSTGLFVNKHAWNRVANIIFVESPVGVGYSYADQLPTTFTDNQTAEDAHAFLVGWVKKFPEYAHNDIYIAGESYGGHYVPQLAQKVVEYNENGGYHINLKGFMVGNAWTDPYSDNLGATEAFYAHGLISQETYFTLLENCDFAHDLPVDVSLVNSTCSNAAEKAMAVEMAQIDIYDIYGPFCTGPGAHGLRSLSAPKSTFFRTHSFLGSPYPDPCADPITAYLRRPEVINAFHASSSKNSPWEGCSYYVEAQYSKADITTSLLPLYHQLIEKGLKIWVYSGDTDGIVPTLSTRLWLRALNLTVETPWYAWNQSTQVGGFTEKYQGLTFATVHQAGHFVPLFQPERALTLFEHFLKDELLPPFQ